MKTLTLSLIVLALVSQAAMSGVEEPLLCGWTLDGGKTWHSTTDGGKTWHLTTDGGKTWDSTPPDAPSTTSTVVHSWLRNDTRDKPSIEPVVASIPDYHRWLISLYDTPLARLVNR